MHCLVLYVLHLDLCSLMYKAEWNVRILFLMNQDVTHGRYYSGPYRVQQCYDFMRTIYLPLRLTL
jgi:hypothetical protein